MTLAQPLFLHLQLSHHHNSLLVTRLDSDISPQPVGKKYTLRQSLGYLLPPSPPAESFCLGTNKKTFLKPGSGPVVLFRFFFLSPITHHLAIDALKLFFE